MTDPSVLLRGADSTTAPRVCLMGDRWTASVDLDLANATRTNVLVVGREQRVTDFLNLLDMPLDPIARDGARRLRLPERSSSERGLILRNVDELTSEEQTALLRWLESDGRGRRLVTTSSTRLLPLVNAGLFDETLYYRLNLTFIDLSL